MLKKTRPIIGLALGLLLFGSAMSSAFAAGNPVTGNQGSPAEAAITKQLEMPLGTTTPAVTFTFNIDPKKVDGDTNETPPALNSAAGSLEFKDTDAGEPVNGKKVVTHETPNLFTGVSWTHTGEYVYEITEIAGADSTDNEFWYYSLAKYELTVLVKLGSDGKYYVAQYQSVVKIADTDEEDGDKVDARPGDETDTHPYSDMIFTNKYVKTNGPTDPETPDPTTESTLIVSKTVTGDLGDTKKQFDFSITLTYPTLLPDVTTPLPAYYRAYVVANNAVIDPKDNADASLIGQDGDDGNKYIKVSTSAATAYTLKHGQRLVFVDTPVGSPYVVTETQDNYITTVIVKTAGSAEDLHAVLTTSSQLVGDGAKNTEANSAAFTNNRESVSMTGVLINNLPFVGLIALALGALVAYVVVRARKSKVTS